MLRCIAVDLSQPRSSLSFSLRSLLLAALMLAVACIAAAPIVRNLTADQQSALIRILVAMAAGAVPTAATLLWLRYRVERRRGAVLVTLPGRSRVIRLLLVVLPLIVMVFTPLYFISDMTKSYFSALEVARNANFRISPAPIMPGAFLAGANIAMGLVLVFWSRLFTTVELCTNGITWLAVSFVPWSAVRVRQSDETSGRLILLLNKYALRLVVPPAEWPKIRDVLHEHVPDVVADGQLLF